MKKSDELQDMFKTYNSLMELVSNFRSEFQLNYFLILRFLQLISIVLIRIYEGMPKPQEEK